MTKKQESANKDRPKVKRPPYRCFFETLIDDPIFRDLSAHGKLVFFVLSLQLGASGIDVFYSETLPRLSSLSADECRKAIKDLETVGWLQIERDLFWLVYRLRDQPAYLLGNENHLKSIVGHLRSLPLQPIVQRFAEHYTLTGDLREHLSLLRLSESHPQSHLDPIGDQEKGERRQERGTKLSITGEGRSECGCVKNGDTVVEVCDECRADLPF
jgi:hypothetical protein